MAKVFSDDLWVSIDIGTTKICVLIGNRIGPSEIEVLGIGRAPSDGLRKGVVVDVARTVLSIKNAVRDAQLMADRKIEAAYIGIAGAHIESVNSHGVVPIKSGEVRASDIANVISSAKAIPVPEGQQILHVMPQYFVIDGQEKIQDPLGMHGIRLEVFVHIIKGGVASVRDLIKCCEMAGVKVADIILEQLASADAVLTDDERELGVALLDIGGGTSDLAIYQKGSIRHTMVLPIAGNHFTNDLALGLRTTISDAERVKHEYGMANSNPVHPDSSINSEVNALACPSKPWRSRVEGVEGDEQIEIALVHGQQTRMVPKRELIRIMQPRAQELLALVHEEIITRNLQSLMGAGLVLTGGGALLTGLDKVAEEIFEAPVRIGRPKITYGLPESLDNPQYATAYGLLLHALKKEKNGFVDQSTGPWAKRLIVKMKSWVADFF